MLFMAGVGADLGVVAHLLELLHGLHDDVAHARVAEDGHVAPCPN